MSGFTEPEIDWSQDQMGVYTSPFFYVLWLNSSVAARDTIHTRF